MQYILPHRYVSLIDTTNTVHGRVSHDCTLSLNIATVALSIYLGIYQVQTVLSQINTYQENRKMNMIRREQTCPKQKIRSATSV